MSQIPEIIINPISKTEVNSLADIAIRTFDETFSGTNSEENMKDYFSRCFTVEQLLRELEEPQSWFYFARTKGKIAGYLKINIGTAQTELKEDEGFEVERIYVLKEYYGKGVGRELMDFAIKRGREEGKNYFWLGVHEENYRALRFYEKIGMKQFSDHVFMMGKQAQRDLLLKMDL